MHAYVCMHMHTYPHIYVYIYALVHTDKYTSSLQRRELKLP